MPLQPALDRSGRSSNTLPPPADRLGRLLPAATQHLPRDPVAATNHRVDAETPNGPRSRRRRTATTATHGTARIYYATDDDSDAPPFPPRIFRYRNRSRRPDPYVAAPRADCAAPVINDFLPLQKIVEAATAAAIAAVDHHLAHLELTSRPDTTSSHGTVHYPRSHAVPRLETISLPDTVHHLRSHAIPRSDTAPSHDTVLHRPHAVPRPATASLHDTVPHCRSRAIPAPLAPLAPPTGLVVPTTEPSAISARASCPPGGSAAVADPSGVTPTHNGYPFAPLVSTPAPLQPPAPTAHPAMCDKVTITPQGKSQLTITTR